MALAAARAERELVIARVFDAPRELVFCAWTDPVRFAQWCGPQGFGVTVLEMDVRPGGAWRKRMRSPDGVDYSRSGVYREVVVPERLVFTYESDDPAGIAGFETLVTIDFIAQGGKTLMNFRQGAFESAATLASHTGGWTSAFERFSQFLSGSR
jgi:uncharacterized protein YndB with AHSA1/START domain